MPLDNLSPRSLRSAVRTEEERVWVSFYQRVSRDTAMAADVMAQLEADPEMKRLHLGLYLRCRQAQRRHKERQARHKRVGQWIRQFARTVLLGPWLAAGSVLAGGRDLLVASLPTPRAEPAGSRSRRLVKQPGYAAARAAFDDADTVIGGDASEQSSAVSHRRAREAA